MATIDDDTPVALLRFRRVAHEFEDFAEIVSNERERHRSRRDLDPSVTRLLGPNTFDRLTLTGHRIELHRSDGISVDDLDDVEGWNAAIERWFPTLLVGGRASGSVRGSHDGVRKQRRDRP